MLLIFCFVSCKREKYKVDTSNINLDVKINRMDKDFSSINSENYYTKVIEIQKKYPEVFQLYVEQIARRGSMENNEYIEPMKEYFLDQYSIELYKDVLRKFPDMSVYEEELEDAFKRVKFFFPEDTIPQIYSLVSDFVFSAASYENMLLISLDMYLGSDYRYYSGLFPVYKIKRMRPEYIVSQVLQAYYMEKFPKDIFAGKDLLSNMLYEGKKLFFVDLAAPWIADSLKIEYTKEQLKWCQKNEGEIWNQLLTNKAIFETESQKYSRYLDDGPFTNAYGFSQQSPARIGEFVGWQIVKNYMNTNKNASPVDVFKIQDAQKILTLSAYKPKI
jgi:hypothetical protein